MKYNELENFMEEYINPDGSIDWEGIQFKLEDGLEQNHDKLTCNVPTHYFADELIYGTFRNMAELYEVAYPSKNQLVKWFKEKGIYSNVLELVENAR
ncbi:hypothetical protein [Selenomonas ruminantium]|uniref:hypothetical protein n=1 Tax=Selenomonas ruminantium TaxID=971 RepID=UPI0026EC5050|nr:hypothetical protein [Selenomonas ruminantium]